MSIRPNNPSAGVYTSEIDRAVGQRTFSVSTGVVCAASHRGPVMQRVKLTDT